MSLTREIIEYMKNKEKSGPDSNKIKETHSKKFALSFFLFLSLPLSLSLTPYLYLIFYCYKLTHNSILNFFSSLPVFAYFSNHSHYTSVPEERNSR